MSETENGQSRSRESSRSTPDVVVAGCGAMGLPMAQALYEAGFDTHGYDVRDKQEFTGFGHRMLENPLGRAADSCLLVVVRDQQQIIDLCFGKTGVYKQPCYPKTLVISSTVSPRFIDNLPKQLPDDVILIDAPMSGAPHSARDRTLTFMLGGPAAVVNRLMPLFDAMGKQCFHMGDTGQGMLAKVLNNYVAAISVVAVRRCIHHADSAGMDYRKLLDVMEKSSGANWYASNLNRIDWANEVYSANNTIGILEKDVKSALDFIEHALPWQHDQPGRDNFNAELLNGLRELPAFPEV